MAAGSTGWQVPVEAHVGSTYGVPRGKRRHEGLDLPVAVGTPVLASRDGIVVRASWHDAFGNVVVIDHGLVDGKRAYTLYAHLDKLSVARGAVVRGGDQLGASGSTGRASTGPHLHFELIEAPSELGWLPEGKMGPAGDVYRVDPRARIPGLEVVDAAPSTSAVRAPAADAGPIVPGERIGPVAIGMTIEAVAAALGPSPPGPQMGDGSTSYEYAQRGLTVQLSARSGLVWTVITRNGIDRTAEGIGVGVSGDEIVPAFGSGYERYDLPPPYERTLINYVSIGIHFSISTANVIESVTVDKGQWTQVSEGVSQYRTRI